MKTTRHIGNCQVCEGDFKLAGDRMVHHGYKRPGDGYIVGDCGGQGELPYELSCDAVKRHIAYLGTVVKGAEKLLGELESGRVTLLTEWKDNYRTGRQEKVEYVVGVTDPRRFAEAVSSAVWKTKHRIEAAGRDIVRCTARVAAWRLQPVRTVEEEQRKEDGAKAERKAAREAARAAKAAKQAATRAKQAELAARREALRRAVEVQFEALAPGGLANREQAMALIRSVRNDKKNASWLTPWDLRCQDALIALGLAHREHGTYQGRPLIPRFVLDV